MSFGDVASVDLLQARQQAALARAALYRSEDPLDLRDEKYAKARAEEQQRQDEKRRERVTLARFARQYHEKIEQRFRNEKHRAQWINSLEQHVPAKIWNAPIDGIEAGELLDALRDLQQRLPETGRRVKGRLETVFAEAVIRKIAPTNPVSSIAKLLRAPKPKTTFAALPFAEAPALVARLRALPGTAARALEFGMLTASRTGEIINATFAEFDLGKGVWIVPAARMKAGEEHVVYLSDRAIEIIEGQKKALGKTAKFVFPSQTDPDEPISNMGMLMLLRRLGVQDRTTVHGLCRATFSTWANETAAARPDVIEACLAHKEGDRIRAAYNRAQFAEERAALLAKWATYLEEGHE
jgi:integrase